MFSSALGTTMAVCFFVLSKNFRAKTDQKFCDIVPVFPTGTTRSNFLYGEFDPGSE